jgi:hypothetical protein
MSAIFTGMLSSLVIILEFNVYNMQIDVITNLLSGRLVRERIGPAMLSAVQSQVN